MKKCITFALLALPLFVFAQQRLDLSGEWKVSLNNSGDQTIMLPNTLDGAGIGEPNTLGPALTKPQLSRLTRKHSFIGEAKYQREITITKEMAGKPLELLLERVMWRSRLLIDRQDPHKGNKLFPTWEHFIPTVGTKHSQAGNIC